jgi:hypothetical protein
MTETLTPNPYSPYATAQPGVRHIFTSSPFLLGERVPWVLGTTACRNLAVVLDEPVLPFDKASSPPGICPTCLAAVRGQMVISAGEELTRCDLCRAKTRQGQWCSPCRESLHRAWWAEQRKEERPCPPAL